MVKIVIIGSVRYAPYEVIVPTVMYGNDHDYLADLAFEKQFKKAIEECDLVIVFAPDGIGKHTYRDMKYASDLKKPLYYIRGKIGD